MSHLPKNVTWEWDISTLKRSFYVNFMLPKDLFNYKKLQDNFLTRLDPPPHIIQFKKNALWSQLVSMTASTKALRVYSFC